MFLALKEIRKEKLRYGLIIGMIVLISYLIFMLTSLALGLAQQNTNAINSWHAQSIVLNKDSNVNLNQSRITRKQLNGHSLSSSEAVIGSAPVVATSPDRAKISGNFIGLNDNQYIAKNLKISSGRKADNQHEIVVDRQLQQAGYRLGDYLKLNDGTTKYKIVGFTKNAEINIAPIIYGSMSDWKTLSNAQPSIAASAIVSKKATLATNSPLKKYSVQTFINKLPGYSAQNMTFSLMIGFLMVISLIVIAVFLYILTIQKLPNFAVLRAQGVPVRVLVTSTLSQSVILVLGGLAVSVILTIITAVLLPSVVPITFSLPILALVGLGVVVTSVLGGLLPIRSVIKVDPANVIGG